MCIRVFTCDSLTYSRNLIAQVIFAVDISKLYLNVILCQLEVKCVFVFTNASMGIVASAIFFVHIATFGQCKRNIFRNRSCATMISNGVNPINKGDGFVPADNITETNFTHFDPPDENDIEPDTL